MPVIRVRRERREIPAETRSAVVDSLAAELQGQPIPAGPIVFEMPLDRQDRMDVLVVWDAWQPFDESERSDLIEEAYNRCGGAERIALAMGATRQEALEQRLLPYAVRPMVRKGEVAEEDLKRAMLEHGGFPLDNGKIDLRFPTLAMAEQAHETLTVAMPAGHWSLIQTNG